MSKITDYYNALNALIQTELPSYVGIPNPYELEQNPNIFLQQGYAIGFGDGNNPEPLLNCKYSYNRTILLALTKQVTANITDFDGMSADALQLLEDLHKLLLAIEKENNLGGASSSRIASDPGVQLLVFGEAKYLALQIQITIQYFESLT